MESGNELLHGPQLQEIILLSKEHDRGELARRMYNRVKQDFQGLLAALAEGSGVNDNNLKDLIHNLKNGFATLGGRRVSKILDELYQLAKTHQIKAEAGSSVVVAFQTCGAMTLDQIGSELEKAL